MRRKRKIYDLFFVVVIDVVECSSYLREKVSKTLLFSILWPVAE